MYWVTEMGGFLGDRESEMEGRRGILGVCDRSLLGRASVLADGSRAEVLPHCSRYPPSTPLLATGREKKKYETMYIEDIKK